MALDQEQLVLTKRYNRLYEVAQSVIIRLTPNGVEVLLAHILAGGGSIDLGLNKVVALLPETSTPSDRDHLVLVHLAAIEVHMYRHGFCPTGHVVRIMAGNYRAAPEEEKQSIIRNGFGCVVHSVSSAAELDAVTPLKAVTDGEYSDLYERLVAAWDCPAQKAVAAMMRTRLATIHELLPRHKIGVDFNRIRAGREEPLPLYVRNEIHHPSTDGLAGSKAFQHDKRIGYAIMAAWLAEKD